MPDAHEPLSFADRRGWRSWLQANHERAEKAGLERVGAREAVKAAPKHQAEGAFMSRKRSIRLIETWYHRMWNRWDKSVFEQILVPEVAFRGSLGQVKHGYAGLSEYMDYIRAAFPDFTNRIEEIICEGDRAFARLSYTGTHEGEIFGVGPTHKSITYAGAAVFSFAEEKIREVWVLGDIHGLLRQLSG